MKKIIITPALALFASMAYAQSSVTLYGIIDEGLNYTNNAGGNAAYQLASGFVQGSRFGLKGSEDLGGDLKAVFQLENGFNASTGALGQGGRMFGRQAFVGLTSGGFGSVLIGRQYDAVVDYLGPMTANGNWGGQLISHPYDNDNTDNSFRVNNTVKYISPDFSGFKFGGTYGFSNDTNFANNRAYSFGAQYGNGPFLVSAAYLKANNPGTTAGGAIASNAANFISGGYEVYGAGAQYNFGKVTASLAYTHSSITNPAATATNGSVGTIAPASGTLNALTFDNIEISSSYQVSPALLLGASYTYTTMKFDATSGNSRKQFHTFGLMADYWLSKRTDVYLQGAYMKAGGDQTGTVLDFGYVSGSAGVSSTSNQVVIRAGIRHKF